MIKKIIKKLDDFFSAFREIINRLDICIYIDSIDMNEMNESDGISNLLSSHEDWNKYERHVEICYSHSTKGRFILSKEYDYVIYVFALSLIHISQGIVR